MVLPVKRALPALHVRNGRRSVTPVAGVGSACLVACLERHAPQKMSLLDVYRHLKSSLPYTVASETDVLG